MYYFYFPSTNVATVFQSSYLLWTASYLSSYQMAVSNRNLQGIPLNGDDARRLAMDINDQLKQYNLTNDCLALENTIICPFVLLAHILGNPIGEFVPLNPDDTLNNTNCLSNVVTDDQNNLDDVLNFQRNEASEQYSPVTILNLLTAENAVEDPSKVVIKPISNNPVNFTPSQLPLFSTQPIAKSGSDKIRSSSYSKPQDNVQPTSTLLSPARRYRVRFVDKQAYKSHQIGEDEPGRLQVVVSENKPYKVKKWKMLKPNCNSHTLDNCTAQDKGPCNISLQQTTMKTISEGDSSSPASTVRTPTQVPKSFLTHFKLQPKPLLIDTSVKKTSEEDATPYKPH